jgi:hypothetical protein
MRNEKVRATTNYKQQTTNFKPKKESRTNSNTGSLQRLLTLVWLAVYKLECR